MITTYKKLMTFMKSCKSHEGQGHWISKTKINPENNFGFIYGVYDHTTNITYLGRKQFHITGKKTKAGKNGVRVKNSRFGKPTNWRRYTSSSLHVNQSIHTNGIDNFTFFHIATFSTKSGLSYAEPNILHRLDVITSVDANGYRLFYNNAIPSVKFIPIEVNELISFKKLDKKKNEFIKIKKGK